MRATLRQARLNRGYTHEDVARLVGISRRMYSYIENGQRDPSFDLAVKLERLFGIPASVLLAVETTETSAAHPNATTA